MAMVVGCSSAQPPQTNNNRQITVPTTYIADLPSELDFCGERVPLEFGDVREALRREMMATMYMHTTTLQTLSRTTRYFPVIEPILKEMGIPEDFKYLAMTESSLNPNAASGAGARGMWQFMASAAKDFAVETGDNIDMRYDVVASTRAACKYLKKAYDKYGSWTLAAASYNMGMGGLSSRISTQGVKNYFDLYMPEETMRYVFHILAYKIMTPDPTKFGFMLDKDDYYPAYKNIKTVEVDDAVIDWSKVAQNSGTNYKILRTLNPWIRSYTYTNSSRRKFKISIPTGDFRRLGY